MEADFSGYATKAGLKCTDGRTIMPDAFKHQDKVTVPLVWQHGHNDPENVLGHAVLEARPDGMYAQGFFNDTQKGQATKLLVEHGDINFLSIYANQLVEKAKQVFHGVIREVSLVLAGANPGAKIDYVAVQHSDGEIEEIEDEAIISTGIPLSHADDPDEDDEADDEDEVEDDDETVKDVYDSFTDKQKQVVQFMIGAALEDADSQAEHSDSDDEEDITHQEGNKMTRNIFEQNNNDATTTGATLTHDQLAAFKQAVAADFATGKSSKAAFFAHAEEYGITNIETLFPDAKNVTGTPEWITRKMEWVETLLNGARKLPFSRFKSRSADLTHEEARAKGYIKAGLKKEQYFSIAARETGPTTIYKKQKLDRDDIIDITDFDVVNWMWQEMRFMLREEIARAILLGDGRQVEDPERINPEKIRPIASDDNFYTHRLTVAPNTSGEDLIEAVLRGRKYYKGGGNPTMYTTEDIVTDLLLLKDKMGRRLYPTQAELESALRVSNIVTVDVMEGHKDGDNNFLLAIFVNMSDYSIGTDRGGEITTFDDFDIDYNQYKYLIEGRMSGALTQHKRALALWRSAGTKATPVAPTFDDATNTITIPTTTGVDYLIDGVIVTGDKIIEADTTVEADPKVNYYFEPGTVQSWNFIFNTSA